MYKFELNNAKRGTDIVGDKIKATSPIVEVFSAMADGKELPKKFSKDTNDRAVAAIKGLGEMASKGNTEAMAEINEIRKFIVEPRLLQEVRLWNVFGSYRQLDWGETAYVVSTNFENVRAEKQAEGQDVPTPFIRRTETPVAPVTISAGYKVNYRHIALGNMEDENILQDQIRVEMRNKGTAYILSTVYNTIKNATGVVKYFYESAGLNKTQVDALLTKLRRYGRPTIAGSYALLSEFNPWIGYSGTTPAVTGVSLKALDEILDNGLLGTYNGSVLQEIPNPYNFNQLNGTGDNYTTLLPDGLAIVLPAAPSAGDVAPIQTFSIGGITTFTGNNVSTGEVMSRFDLAVAAAVAPGREDTIGIINDTNLSGTI